jgi:hypothetical protein
MMTAICDEGTVSGEGTTVSSFWSLHFLDHLDICLACVFIFPRGLFLFLYAASEESWARGYATHG